jgi:hypothetical protein
MAAPVGLADSFRPDALESLEKHRELTARAIRGMDPRRMTFGAAGGIKRPVANHCMWVKYSAGALFLERLLMGDNGSDALDQAIAFAQGANAKHNAQNAAYFSNQVYADHGVDYLWGLFYRLRDRWSEVV